MALGATKRRISPSRLSEVFSGGFNRSTSRSRANALSGGQRAGRPQGGPQGIQRGSRTTQAFEAVNAAAEDIARTDKPDYTPQKPEVASTPSGGGGGGGGGPGPAGPSQELVSFGGYRYAKGVVGHMRFLANTFGLTPSSGFRDPSHNARVGGVPNSNHLTGRAGDFSGSSSQMSRGAAWARSAGAREVLTHNAGSGVHLHVAF